MPVTGAPAGTTQVAGIAMPGTVVFSANGDVYCLDLGTATSPNTQLMGSTTGGAVWQPADSGDVAAYASCPGNMVMTPAGRIYIATNSNTITYGYPSVPSPAGATSMAVTLALSATGTDASSGTKTGAASMAVTLALSAVPGAGGRLATAPMAVVAALTAQIGTQSFVLQVVQGTSAFDYGLSSVEMTTAAGSTLIVLAGWDLSTGDTTAPMPAAYVSDSAGNFWQHVTTTTSAVTGARACAWICPNALGIEWLSVSLTAFASSLAYTVLELARMPSLYSLDCYDATAAQAASSLMLSPGSAADDDFVFALFATGALTGAGPAGPAGWTALPSVSAGPGSPPGITPPGGSVPVGWFPALPPVPTVPGNINPVTIYPYYQVATPGTPLALTFDLGQTVPCAALVFAVRSTVYPPWQPNPGMPVLKVEAAFGAVPGDPSQAPPPRTDITSRVIAPEGGTWVTTASGRQYELAQAEAGTIEISLDNHDGAFTPGSASAYAGLALGNPIWVSAFWQGRWHAVAAGFVERYPQEWPDLPQWGISKMVATDAISVLAAVTMGQALDGDILADAPYVFLSAAEQYLSFSNGINNPSSLTNQGGVLGSFSTADGQGLPAQNYSRSNQRPGMYVDGNGAATGGNGPAIAATGQTTNLLGSSATGFGTTAISAAPTSPSCGPGIIYTDPNVPDPSTGFGVTVSFWAIIAANTVSAQIQPTLFTAYGPPSSYKTTPSLTVQALNFTGGNTLTVTLADGTVISAPFTPSATAQQITLVFTASSLNLYINGALEAASSLTAAQTTQWVAVSLGCPNYAYQSAGLGSGAFTCFDLAIFPYPLPAQRAVSQYVTGLFGQQNVDATARMAQILAWAGLGLPRGGRQTFNGVADGVTQGPAYSLSGAAASDAINQIALNHTAMVAAMPGGALTYIHRWGLFNLPPVATFGDSPDPSQGEVPFVPGQSWGYDNTYLYNLASVTQQFGPNNLFTVNGADFTSQHQYYARSALQQTITTMNNQDAIQLLNWLIAKYGQPSPRVSVVTIDAASTPNVAFSTILTLLQGQAATVVRTPVGGAQIIQTCLLQRVAHSIGPNTWQTALQLSPYDLESAVLTLDTPGYNVAGNNALA